MDTQVYMTIQGRDGHRFQGDGTSNTEPWRTSVTSVGSASPPLHGAATGKASAKRSFFSSGGSQLYINRIFGPGPASGQRVYKPINIVKEWGPASPQIYQALVSKQVLAHVTLQFINTTPQGEEDVSLTVKLSNVTIVGLTRTPHHRPKKSSHTYQYEQIALTFEKIMITSSGKKKGFTDNWNLGG